MAFVERRTGKAIIKMSPEHSTRSKDTTLVINLTDSHVGVLESTEERRTFRIYRTEEEHVYSQIRRESRVFIYPIRPSI